MQLRDAERLKERVEVTLDGRQIFFLFFGGAVVASLVFVLGVMVGRRLEGREMVAARASTSAAVDPLAALDELGAEEAQSDTLAFPQALARPAPKGEAEEHGAPVVKAKEKEKEKAVAAPLAKEMMRPAPVPAPEPAAVAPAPAAPVVAKATASSSRYTLQISSFQAREEADALADKLRAAGYKPKVVESNIPEKGIWHRVRVGDYGSREEAMEGKAEFEKKVQIIAYVTKL
jgi:cell division septation protein DedD